MEDWISAGKTENDYLSHKMEEKENEKMPWDSNSVSPEHIVGLTYCLRKVVGFQLPMLRFGLVTKSISFVD